MEPDGERWSTTPRPIGDRDPDAAEDVSARRGEDRADVCFVENPHRDQRLVEADADLAGEVVVATASEFQVAARRGELR